jgi:membrane protein
MFRSTWRILKDSVFGFIEDDALSRGAAMAFYAVTSLAPILLIVVAVAGIAFGQDAAQNAVADQLTNLMGRQSAEMLENAIKSASNKSTGTIATVIGLATVIVSASGVFGEMQSALNAIWKVVPVGTPVSRLIRARAASLGLVAALGFLLLVSLVVSAGISALSQIINAYLPFGAIILSTLNAAISFVMISVLFSAIYKVLPDRRLEWRDVLVGAIATAVLFTVGKSLIGWYLGTTAVASSYGAAGTLLIVLLWVYYSSEIFLLGAEFTRAYSIRHGSRRDLAEAPLGAHWSGSRDARIPRSAVTANSVRRTTSEPKLTNGTAAASGGLTAIAVCIVLFTFIRDWKRQR